MEHQLAKIADRWNEIATHMAKTGPTVAAQIGKAIKVEPLRLPKAFIKAD